MKKRLTRISAIILTAAVAAGGAGGVNAFAETTNHAPTEAKTIGTTIVTATAHRAAAPLPDMLGANVPSGYGMINGYGTTTISQNAIGNFALEVWGSSWNDKPDPYWWNYYYNFNGGSVGSSDVLLNADGQGSPVKADTNISSTYGGVSASIFTKPDVLIGVDVSNSYTESYAGYDSQITTIQASDPSYAPKKARYNPAYLEDMIDSVYEAADAIEATGKATRYSETPSEIAEEYENYILGIRGYITSQIGSNNYKKIAIISGATVSNTGEVTYTIDGYGSAGANSTNRYIEYTKDYTNNLYDDLDDSVKDLEKYTATVSSQQLLNANAIIITTDAVEDIVKTDSTIINSTSKPEMISVNAMKSLYGIRMNSVENALGMGYILGRIYDQYDAAGFLSAKNLYEYYAEKFYHIDTSVSTNLDEFLTFAIKDNLTEHVYSDDNPISDEDTIEVDHIMNDVSSSATYGSYNSQQITNLLAQYAAN